jgi:hypothetical protein
MQGAIGDLKQWYKYRHAYWVALYAAVVSKLSDIVLAAVMSTVFKEQGKHPQQSTPLFIYATHQNDHWFIVSRPRETAQRLFRSPRDLVRSQYVASRKPLYIYIYMLRQAQQPMAHKRSRSSVDTPCYPSWLLQGRSCRRKCLSRLTSLGDLSKNSWTKIWPTTRKTCTIQRLPNAEACENQCDTNSKWTYAANSWVKASHLN